MMINHSHHANHGAKLSGNNTGVVSASSTKRMDKDDQQNCMTSDERAPESGKTKMDYTSINRPLTALLRNAERHFLQQRYREALFTVNQAFVQLSKANTAPIRVCENTKKARDDNDVVALSASLQLPGSKRKRLYQISVSLTLDYMREQQQQHHPSNVAHKLAMIGLQAWHELSSKDASQPSLPTTRCRRSPSISSVSPQAWKHLEPILLYFSSTTHSIGSDNHRLVTRNHPISSTTASTSDVCIGGGHPLSIDLLAVWIPFWASHGFARQAFLWASQVLLVASDRTRRNRQMSSKTQGTVIESMWHHYVCRQLPHVRDPAMAVHILKSIATNILDSGDVKYADLAGRMEESWDDTQVHLETWHGLLETLNNILDEFDEERKEETNITHDDDMVISSKTMQKARARLLKVLESSDVGRSACAKEQEHDEGNESVAFGSDTTLVTDLCSTQPASRNQKSTTMVLKGQINGRGVEGSSRNSLYKWLSCLLSVGKTGTDGTRPRLSLDWLCNLRSIDPDSSAHCRGNVQAIALSVALLLLSWRQRGIVGRLGKSVASALLAPIRELVDALVGAPSPPRPLLGSS